MRGIDLKIEQESREIAANKKEWEQQDNQLHNTPPGTRCRLSPERYNADDESDSGQDDAQK